jgi:hypothetical protein
MRSSLLLRSAYLTPRSRGDAPNTGYQHQVCGEGDNVNSYTCVGDQNGNPEKFVTATKSDCIYTAHSLSTLATFDQLTGHDFSCVMLFAGSSPLVGLERTHGLEPPAVQDT